MIRFKILLEKFEKKGEKTGWTYIPVSAERAHKLNNQKTAFRVKGSIDQHTIAQTSLLPMGNGDFILPINGEMRRAIKKKHGQEVIVQLDFDPEELQPDEDFLVCLHELPKALKNFEALNKGHQNYFTNWIKSAKTPTTKANRIAKAMSALQRSMGFGEMLREK